MKPNYDNLADTTAKAKELSDAQLAIDASKQEKTAAEPTDKVSSTLPETVTEDQGLSGQVRETQPTRDTAVSDTPFSRPVASSLNLVEQYELKMGTGTYLTTGIIDEYQRNFYNAINNLLTTPNNTEFVGVMDILFAKFRKDERGAFSPDRVMRRLTYLKLSDSRLNAYLAILDVFLLFNDPKGRSLTYRQYVKENFLNFFTNPEYRQRMETYMTRICS